MTDTKNQIINQYKEVICLFTVYDLVSVMPHHEYKIILQNDANEDPDYVPHIFSNIEELMGSDLLNSIADFEVTDTYAENDGTIWICYECYVE